MQSVTHYVVRHQDCIEQGKLQGLLLTGMNDAGFRLLEAYVDRTSDVQTACVLTSLVHKFLGDSTGAGGKLCYGHGRACVSLPLSERGETVSMHLFLTAVHVIRRTAGPAASSDAEVAQNLPRAARSVEGSEMPASQERVAVCSAVVPTLVLSSCGTFGRSLTLSTGEVWWSPSSCLCAVTFVAAA